MYQIPHPLHYFTLLPIRISRISTSILKKLCHLLLLSCTSLNKRSLFRNWIGVLASVSCSNVDFKQTKLMISIFTNHENKISIKEIQFIYFSHFHSTGGVVILFVMRPKFGENSTNIKFGGCIGKWNNFTEKSFDCYIVRSKWNHLLQYLITFLDNFQENFLTILRILFISYLLVNIHWTRQ